MPYAQNAVLIHAAFQQRLVQDSSKKHNLPTKLLHNTNLPKLVISISGNKFTDRSITVPSKPVSSQIRTQKPDSSNEEKVKP